MNHLSYFRVLLRTVYLVEIKNFLLKIYLYIKNNLKIWEKTEKNKRFYKAVYKYK